MGGLLMLVFLVLGVPVMAFADWANAVDLSTVTTDVTAIGTVILGIAAVILGYRIVKGLVRRG